MLMLNFLEASHFKINSCLCKLEGRALPQHPFQPYISTTRDKQVRGQRPALIDEIGREIESEIGARY